MMASLAFIMKGTNRHKYCYNIVSNGRRSALISFFKFLINSFSNEEELGRNHLDINLKE